MTQEQKTSRMPQIGEVMFCIAYPVFDLIAAVILLVSTNGSQALYLFGVLTFVLGGGDASCSKGHKGISRQFSQSRMVARSRTDDFLNHHDRVLCVAVLCLDKAGFITGENICIDGGITRQMIYRNGFGWKLVDKSGCSARDSVV